jgi:glycosyltransferase involved in cell wall biosynthesis
MEITQVGSYPPPYGGQSVHIKNLKNFLVARGHHCSVINTGTSKTVSEPGIINAESSMDLTRKLWGNRSELVHVHCGPIGTFFKFILCAAISKACRGQAVVLTVHSGGFVDDVKRLFAVRKRLFLKMLRRADFIVCVNESIRSFLAREGVDEKKTATIPAYSLREDLTAVRLSDRVEEFLSRHDPVLSCMGFFEPQYGFDLALDAVKLLKRTHPASGLVIMASGGRGGLSSRVEEKLNDPDVLVLRDQDKSSCLTIVSRSLAFLRPTAFDGDAISVREALAIGTPVIASSVVARPVGTILVERGEVKELVARLEELLSAEEPAPRRNLVVEDEDNLDRILECYGKVLEGKSR